MYVKLILYFRKGPNGIPILYYCVQLLEQLESFNESNLSQIIVLIMQEYSCINTSTGTNPELCHTLFALTVPESMATEQYTSGKKPNLKICWRGHENHIRRIAQCPRRSQPSQSPPRRTFLHGLKTSRRTCRRRPWHLLPLTLAYRPIGNYVGNVITIKRKSVLWRNIRSKNMCSHHMSHIHHFDHLGKGKARTGFSSLASSSCGHHAYKQAIGVLRLIQPDTIAPKQQSKQPTKQPSNR